MASGRRAPLACVYGCRRISAPFIELHRVRSLQVRSYHRCELDRIGEMRDLKNKMWKYGSFGGTERSLTSATYFDTSKPGYVT